MISRFLLRTALLFSTVLLISCDKDFNEIGTGIIGDDHYGFEKEDGFDILTQDIDLRQTMNAVESTNLSVVPFGIYDNPVFGKVTANYVTQVELNSFNPIMDETVEIKDVILYIPYYATLKETTEDGDRIYELDSIFGNRATELNLEIFENKYFLRDQAFDAGGTITTQRYFNDMETAIDAVKGVKLNTAAIPAENTRFSFKPSEHEIPSEDEDEDPEFVAPGMRLKLDKAFFEEKIFNAPEGVLANNNEFKEYFRGLYFKLSDPSISEGVLNMMNFSAGTITINYTTTSCNNTDNDESTPCVNVDIDRSLVLKLTGRSVSLLNYGPMNANIPNNRLTVQGGQGHLTAIKLFSEADENGNGISDDIDRIKQERWLINEASLTFYVDRSVMSSPAVPLANMATEPMRIYLYDMTNKQPVVDYLMDNSSSSNVKKSKLLYGGLVETDQDPDFPRAVRYKIRLTNYLRSMMVADSANVTLGLSVTESIQVPDMNKLKNPVTVFGAQVKEIPKGSVMHPFGTVLYGPNIPAGDPDYDKRLKLVIYYTKPDSDIGHEIED